MDTEAVSILRVCLQGHQLYLSENLVCKETEVLLACIVSHLCFNITEKGQMIVPDMILDCTKNFH